MTDLLSTNAVLAVDFGTSTSSAAVVGPGGHIHMVAEPATGSWSWPSAVYLDGSQLLVGTTAAERRSEVPLAYRAEFKRDLGEPDPIYLGTAAYAPEELVGVLLAELRAEAERVSGQTLDRILCTVPAGYTHTDVRQQLMIAAAEHAGFVDVELLLEPVAAAFAPLNGPSYAAGDVILVYDLGGGTFDAALLEIGSDGRHRVLGHDSRDGCGGRDVDALLVERFRAQGGERVDALLHVSAEADDEERSAALNAEMQLGDLARGAKHQLTSAHTARPFFLPARRRLAVGREELAAIVAPLLDVTIGCCRELAGRVGVPLRTIAHVLLVGGSSRMPVVRESVAAALSGDVRLAASPSTAVVEGAARWATIAATDRALFASEWDAGERPVRWDLPGGHAVLVRWCAQPGAELAAGAEVAVVRLPDASLRALTVPRGRLSRVHADPGTRVSTGDWLITLGGSTVVDHAARHGDRVVGLACLADGTVLSAGAGGRVLAWSHDIGPAGGARGSVVLEAGALRGASFGREGTRVATLGASLVMWEGGRELWAAPAGPDTVAALSPDGHRLAVGLEQQIRVLAAGSGEEVLSRDLQADARSLAFSDDGGRLAVTIGDGSLHLLDASTGVFLASQRLDDPLHGVIFSPDGRRLSTISGWRVVLHDSSGKAVDHVEHGAAVGATCFLPSGELVLGGHDGLVRSIDLESGQVSLERMFAGRVTALAAGPAGLAVARDTGGVHLLAF